MTLRQAETIISLARNNMNARATARTMFVHHQTVIYNIKMIRRNTGLNPLDFYDLQKLIPMAEEVLKND